jgi:hypothetical protein
LNREVENSKASRSIIRFGPKVPGVIFEEQKKIIRL